MRQPGGLRFRQGDRQPAAGPAAGGDPALGALRGDLVRERRLEVARVVGVEVQRRVERPGGRQGGLGDEVGGPRYSW
jgi:hypothetical protein